MSLVQAGVERLLLSLMAVIRVVCLVQGLALAAVLLRATAAAPPEPPAWLRAVGLTAGLASAACFLTGVLLLVVRRWPATSASQAPGPPRPWRAALGVSLVGVSLLAALAASNLPSLWVMIGTQLTAIDFWSGAATPDPYGGIVVLPIVLALFVPVLVSMAAVFAAAYPLALLLLMPARRPLFPALLSMGAICQAGLVLAGWLSADMLGRLAEQALIAMAGSGDAGVLRLSVDLRVATEIVSSTVTALAAPTLVILAWAAFLWPTGRAATRFAARGPLTPDQSPATAGRAQRDSRGS